MQLSILPKLNCLELTAVQCPMVIWLQSHCCAQVLPPLSRFVRPVSSAGTGQCSSGGIAGPSRQSTQCLQQQRPHYQHSISYSVHLYTYTSTQWRCCLQVTCSPEDRGAGRYCYLLRWTILPCCSVITVTVNIAMVCTGAGASAGNTQPGDNTLKQ